MMVILIRTETIKRGLDSGWIFCLTFLRGNLYRMKYIHLGVHFYIFWPICVTTTTVKIQEFHHPKKVSLCPFEVKVSHLQPKQPPTCLQSLYIRFVFSIVSYKLEQYLVFFFVSGFFHCLFLKFTSVYACLSSSLFFSE